MDSAKTSEGLLPPQTKARNEPRPKLQILRSTEYLAGPDDDGWLREREVCAAAIGAAVQAAAASDTSSEGMWSNASEGDVEDAKKELMEPRELWSIFRKSIKGVKHGRRVQHAETAESRPSLAQPRRSVQVSSRRASRRATATGLSIFELQRRLGDLESENANLRRLLAEEEEAEAAAQERRARGETEITVMSDNEESEEMAAQSSVAFNYDMPWDQLPRFQRTRSVAANHVEGAEDAGRAQPQVRAGRGSEVLRSARADFQGSDRRKTTAVHDPQIISELAQDSREPSLSKRSSISSAVESGSSAGHRKVPVRAQKIPTQEPGLCDIDKALSHIADPDDVQTVLRAFVRYEREVRYLQALIADYQDITLERMQGNEGGRQQRPAEG